MMHAKTAIIDDAFTTIGSYNLDDRSWRKNLELNLAVLDRPFAAHVRSWFERDLARATRVDLAQWRQRSLGRRSAELLARTFGKLW
jgi:cardiolipin synthase